MNAKVLFHGFSVPLIGMAQEETQQECEQCRRTFDLLQVRLCLDGRFLCDACAAKNTFAKAES